MRRGKSKRQDSANSDSAGVNIADSCAVLEKKKRSRRDTCAFCHDKAVDEDEMIECDERVSWLHVRCQKNGIDLEMFNSFVALNNLISKSGTKQIVLKFHCDKCTASDSSQNVPSLPKLSQKSIVEEIRSVVHENKQMIEQVRDVMMKQKVIASKKLFCDTLKSDNRAAKRMQSGNRMQEVPNEVIMETPKEYHPRIVLHPIKKNRRMKIR